jgi:DNA-binding CsgD family transcriptional regulator/5-methylcytosine-specific restriction endonuclease McrA
MLGAGVSRSEIARQLGIDRGTVVRVAIRLGFGARVREPEAGWETIRAHYDAGNSAGNCRRLFRISEGAWEMAVARGEIVPRPHNEPIGARGETRRKVAAMLAEGFTVSEVAETLRVSKPTVCHHARKLGIPPGRSKRRYDWSAIREAYDSGLSVRQCMARFGFSTSAWADAVKRGAVAPRPAAMPLSELLVVGRKTGRGHLKRRLIDAGLKVNRCEDCGITEWQGEPLNMALHHINGDGTDNRLENLKLLCANCHSQTPNYGGRNGHRKPRAAEDG